jgi:hypothetical protein
MAWRSKHNMLRGIAFMGTDNVNIVRSSYMPISPIVNNELPADQIEYLNERLEILSLLDKKVALSINADMPSVDTFYYGKPANFAKLIDLTRKYHEDAGYTVVTVSPFNEPDYSDHQGSKQDFYDIALDLRNNYPEFDDIRISGEIL